MRAINTWIIPGGGWLAATACAIGFAALPVRSADEPATASVPPAATAPHPESALQRRVTLLAVELGLDAQQQSAVGRILEDQRRQVMNVWNDASVPAAYRVNATRTISDRTGDRIRALLTDAQKEKYNKPRKPRQAPADTPALSVEDWMKATSPR